MNNMKVLAKDRERVLKIPQIGHAVFCTQEKLIDDIVTAISEARAEERERCAKLVEGADYGYSIHEKHISDFLQCFRAEISGVVESIRNLK